MAFDLVLRSLGSSGSLSCYTTEDGFYGFSFVGYKGCSTKAGLMFVKPYAYIIALIPAAYYCSAMAYICFDFVLVRGTCGNIGIPILEKSEFCGFSLLIANPSML